MTTLESVEDVAGSLFSTDGKPPYAHLRESTTTYRRPLGQNEIGYALIRGMRGYFDSFSIVPLACSGSHTIADEDVVQACAALRLRHPLLASKVAYSTEKPPEFVVHFPMTEAHALREAQAQIEFSTFYNHDAATEALRCRWFTAAPEDALDLRNGACSLYWARDIDSRSGRYILGFMTPHFITDGRRRLNLVRCMLELLTTPGRAKKELAAHFAGATPAVDLPPPWEGLLPDTGEPDLGEIAKARAAFDELLRFRSKPLSGLVPDGDMSDPNAPDRFIRKTWSRGDTRRILQACKSHGVTITHLANVASAFACVQRPGPAGMERSSDEDKYYFEFSSAYDVNAKIPRLTVLGEVETAVRIVVYPVVIAVPRADTVESVTNQTIWAAARQFKEQSDAFVKSPYFWHFCDFYGAIAAENYMAQMAGKPFVPYMSSMGNLKSVLPTRYPVEHPITNGAMTRNGTTSEAEVRILDHVSGGKIHPSVAGFLMYTFDERLNLQFKWNVGRTSDALITGWFDRVAEIMSQVASDET